MTAAAAVLMLVSLPAEAQWKWKDKGGRIQYSDLPPPVGTPDQDILQRPNATRRGNAPAPAAAASAASAPAPVLASASAPRAVEPELEARLKKAEAEVAARKKAEEDRIASARADNCNRARAQLRTYESGIRVTRFNEKGEREYLDDKQRADETRHVRDVIAADCQK